MSGRSWPEFERPPSGACQQLADASQVGNATIRNFESGKSASQNSTLAAIRRALDAEGVNGGAEGVGLGYAVRIHSVLGARLGDIAEYRAFGTKREARAFMAGPLAELKRCGATLGYRPLRDYFWALADGKLTAYTFAGAPMHSEKLALCVELGIQSTDED